ncbi:hypothetical protein [Metabacillus malikii]|uniref:Uncharacterized protein n=1 Tax=Metabacillus malikii TaxID=1504265 RepID=A0ABT9ZNA6_9BACI|nr:hypothetical protein [Metabacillus malikii]MDQ0233404.1 hypothetical protein [Metabacillus malikii]
MRYPGPWQHLTYLRWNKHKNTLTTKYAEWKTAIGFTRKVITKEEFDSLEGRIVYVVEIIDDYEGTVTGDYHVYDNGLIVRVYGGAYYEIVDSVPKSDNIGGAKVLGSFFEDTSFEFVEYVVNPSTIVSKVVRRKIDDVTVGFVGKKGAKGAGNFVKKNGGSNANDFISGHSQKHMYNPNTVSTPKKTQYGKDINVSELRRDTMLNPDSVDYDDIRNTIAYKKKYDFNISTLESPTGQHRVFINLNNPSRHSQFPYFRLK